MPQAKRVAKQAGTPFFAFGKVARCAAGIGFAEQGGREKVRLDSF
jgi:hypothetical protein